MNATPEFKEEIFRTYHPKVVSYIRGKTNNRVLAEDLASEIFIKVYEKLDTFDETKASVSTWIFTITRNRLTDYYRTRKVFSEVPETLQDNSSVEQEYINKESLEMLAGALESLDERLRDLIILRYYSGKTLKEIADILGISYAYVKILHNKALDALRGKME